MNNDNKAPKSGAAFIRAYRRKSPLSIANYLKDEDAVDDLGERLDSDLSTLATAEQRLARLLELESEYPHRFKPRYRGNLHDLTAKQLLEVGNGQLPSGPIEKKRR